MSNSKNTKSFGTQSRGPFKVVTSHGKHRLISDFDGKRIAQFTILADASRFARIVNSHDARKRAESTKKAATK